MYFRLKTETEKPFIPDEKPVKKEKKAPKPLKRTAIKKKPVKIKKHSDTSIRALLNAARVVFQKWVVKRDVGDPCISCGLQGVQLYGGHLLKAEIYSGLIFHEHNVNGQCEECNIMKDGNYAHYYLGLCRKIGLSGAIRLLNSADEHRDKKYTREELNAIIKKYSTKD